MGKGFASSDLLSGLNISDRSVEVRHDVHDVPDSRDGVSVELALGADVLQPGGD